MPVISLRIVFFFIGVMSSPAWAEHPRSQEQIQVPHCLANQLSSDYPVLAENKDFKIIDVPSSALEAIVHKADEVGCGRFINVTHRLQTAKANDLLKKSPKLRLRVAPPYEINHIPEVQALLATLEPANIWDTLTHLSHYYNRSATKDTGVQTAQWLKDSFETMAKKYGRNDTETYFVKTSGYKQPSLVTVLGKTIQAPAVILGAHMDTLDGRMPGAGDDGSGSSTLMEIARVMLSNPVSLNHPVYFIWYAAEERGLVGSEMVVSRFMDQQISVKAVIQFDMTGYRHNESDPTLWIYRDYTDAHLNQFIAKLIHTYVKVPVKYSQCGYGCSDHASWTEANIPAAFPCETSFEDHNPFIHSSSDTMALMNLEHMTNFTKLGIAFAIELAS